MTAEVGKVLAIKHLCKEVNSRIVVLASRLISSIVLIPILLIHGIGFPKDGIFWTVIVATSLITAIGSIWMTDAVKFGNLSAVMPMQAAVPVFSLLTLWIGWHETPERTQSIVLMLLSMAAVGLTLYASNRDTTHAGKSIYAFLSLAAAVLFGFTTILDRVAVARIAHGAFAYTACWNLFSLAVMAFETTRTGAWRGLRFSRSSAGVIVYSLSALAAFISQQYAIELSISIPGAVVHIKSISMLHLPLLVIVGIVLLGERPKPLTLAASLSAIILAFLLVYSVL